MYYLVSDNHYGKQPSSEEKKWLLEKLTAGVQGSFTEKVITEQRYEGGKNASLYISGERRFQADGTAISKAWKQ